MSNRDQVTHALAYHLRALGNIVEANRDELSKEAFYTMIVRLPGEQMVKMAEELEASAPFMPLTDEEKAFTLEAVIDVLRDRSDREVLEDHTADWSEFQWRTEHDAFKGYLNEEEGD